MVERLSFEVVKVLAQPEMVKRLADLGIQAKASTLVQLGQLLDGEIRAGAT